MLDSYFFLHLILLFVPVIVSRLSQTNVDVPLEIPPIIKGFDKKFSIFSEAPIVVPTFPIAEGAPKVPPNAPPNAEPMFNFSYHLMVSERLQPQSLCIFVNQLDTA